MDFVESTQVFFQITKAEVPKEIKSETFVSQGESQETMICREAQHEIRRQSLCRVYVYRVYK